MSATVPADATSGRATSRRVAVEVVVASALVVACGTLAALGVAHWAVTLLPAAYPCGETYQVHPACRLADPGALPVGHALMIAVPAACAVVGTGLAGWTLLLRRRAVLPTAIALLVALAAFLVGQGVADAALTDVVPW